MSSPNPDQVVSDLLARCEASLVSRNFEEAIDGCRAVLSVSPENQRAKELLEEAQSKLEAELFVRENLRKAREYYQLREFQKCVNECQKVQLLDAENLEAIDLMKQAQDKVEAEPFIQNFVNSAQSLFDSGLYDEAFAQWDKVRAIDPFYPGLDELMNKARQMMVGPPPADPRFDSVPERAHGTSAPPAFEIPAEETAEISLDQFGALGDEEKIQYLLRQGDRAFSLGLYQKAIEVWSEIFMLDVNHSEALQKIEQARSMASEQRSKIQELLKEAQAAYDEGRIHDAKDLFEQVKSYDPGNGQAEKYLAMIGGNEEGPATLDDLIVLATGAENRGQYREAAQYYSQALAVDPDNADLADRIKNLNMLAKKQEQGKNVLGNAKAFLAEGKLDSARHALSKILEADPENKEALELMKEVKSIGASPAGAAAAGIASPAISVPSGSSVSVARGKKPLPILKLAIGAGIVLLGGGALAYFFFLRPAPAPPIRPSNSKPRNVVKTKSTTPILPRGSTMITPAAKEKAVKLVQEAQVLFMDKKYPDVIAKAEEALKLDPENKDAKDLKATSEKNISEGMATERKLLDDANSYFAYSEFAGAVKLYEKYLDRHPESRSEVLPQIVKSYYNMGVIAIRLWRCDVAADYFRQVLFIDKADLLSNDALNLARRCEQSGSGDAEVRKAVSMLEMRK